MRAVAVGVDAYLAQKLPRTLSDPTTNDPHGSRPGRIQVCFRWYQVKSVLGGGWGEKLLAYRRARSSFLLCLCKARLVVDCAPCAPGSPSTTNLVVDCGMWASGLGGRHVVPNPTFGHSAFPGVFVSMSRWLFFYMVFTKYRTTNMRSYRSYAWGGSIMIKYEFFSRVRGPWSLARAGSVFTAAADADAAAFSIAHVA